MISKLHDPTQILLQYLQRPQFLLLILPNRLLRDQLFRHPALDQNVVFLTDLHPALLRIELADPVSLPLLLQIELFRLVAGKFYNVEPADGCAFLAMSLEHARWTIENTFEALDEDWTQRSSAEVAGHGFMALEDAIIVGYEGQ